MGTDLEIIDAELVTDERSVGLESHALADAATWVDNWLGTLKPTSARAYRRDLALFAAHTGHDTLGELAAAMLTRRPDSHYRASQAVDSWKADLLDQGLAPATINRRLSAVRSLVRHAHRSGLISWLLTVQGVKSKPYRDTAGPGVHVVREMVQALDDDDSPKACRDRAIVRLLFDMGLRRGEVVALDVADVDFDACKVQVVGKGRREAEPLTIPARTCDAVRAWLAHRGDHAGPLFVNLDRAHEGGRLTGRSVGRIVAAAGEQVGVDNVRAHGLRHSAITHVLDKTNGNVRAARKFSRHAKLDTLAVYDDNREDLAGDMAELIAGDV